MRHVEDALTLLADLAQAAILGASLLLVGAVVYGLSTGWARLCVRLADSGCTCRKRRGRACPVHGRDARDEEPFPGAWPW